MRDLVRGDNQPEDGIYGLPSQPVDAPIRNNGTYQDGLRLNEPVPEPMLETPKPSTIQQLLSEYELRIRFLAKGCVVSVGCKEIAFSTTEEAMEAIHSYVTDPKGEGKFWRGQFNMM